MESPLGEIINELKKEAPLTTRDNVNIIKSASNTGYSLPLNLVNHIPYFSKEEIANRAIDFDTIRFNIEEYNCPKKCDVAKMLTYAYLSGFAKKERGYLKVVGKMAEHQELIERLAPIAKDLEKEVSGFLLFPKRIEDEICYLTEAMACAVSSCYGEYSINSGAIDEIEKRKNQCKELIDFLSIDGARAFVRKKMEQIYKKGKIGPTLEEEVENYKQSIFEFFSTADCYCEK